MKSYEFNTEPRQNEINDNKNIKGKNEPIWRQILSKKRGVGETFYFRAYGQNSKKDLG